MTSAGSEEATVVSVPERGERRLDHSIWRRLADSPEFWLLKERNIVDVTPWGVGRWALRGGCYVGRAIVGGLVLEVTEKRPGVLATLVALAGLGAPRLVEAPSPVTATPESTAILVDALLSTVREYLGSGQERKYEAVQERGAFLSGRLDVRRTSTLWAQGRKHAVAFRRARLSADLPINRSIYAALREVGMLGSLARASPSQVGRARVLGVAFSECVHATLRTPKSANAKAAVAAMDQRGLRHQARDAAALAAAILDTAGFGGTGAYDHVVGRSWFVNIETLFEAAVRQVIRAALDEEWLVERARRRPPLFDIRRDRYRANPDVVISHGGVVLAVADAKYKDFSNWPATSDVHEIIGHAAAYGANKAVLFYPESRGAPIREFGRAATGCELWAAGLRLEAFEEDVSAALTTAGLVA